MIDGQMGQISPGTPPVWGTGVFVVEAAPQETLKVQYQYQPLDDRPCSSAS